MPFYTPVKKEKSRRDHIVAKAKQVVISVSSLYLCLNFYDDEILLIAVSKGTNSSVSAWETWGQVMHTKKCLSNEKQNHKLVPQTTQETVGTH